MSTTMKNILVLVMRILPIAMIGTFLLWTLFQCEALRVHACIGLVALFSFILWKVPQWQVAPLKDKLDPKDWTELEDKYRKTIAQIVGGLAFLVGLYFTWMTVIISQEVQITDRFGRAIEFLGATEQSGSIQLETRLGGIYALERIAKDSDKDYQTIMELLCAYVRRHTSVQGYGFSGVPTPDIQTILTVIGRLGRLADKEGRTIDLSRTNLKGANLAGAYLEAANLEYANLENADLEGAHLAKARLNDAILTNANLKRANLDDADLTRAQMNGATLIQASIKNAVLRTAILRQAKLMEADLTAARLSAADLEGANLRRAILKDTELEGASLWGARLEEAEKLTTIQIESALINAKTRLR